MAEIERKGIDWNVGVIEEKPDYVAEESFFFRSRRGGLRNFLIALFGLAMPFYIIYRAYFGGTQSRLEHSVFVSLVLCYIFLRVPLRGKIGQEQPAWQYWLDWVLFILAAAIGFYVLWSLAVVGSVTEFFTVTILGYDVVGDVVAGTILLVLVLEANRRTMGWGLVAFVLVFLAYVPLRPYLPYPFGGAPLNWDHLIVRMFSVDEGIFGEGTDVLVSLVFLFLIFGSTMLRSKVGAFFYALANSMVGNRTGGAAKASVIASALVGMVSMSSIGNVATVGAITIPIMKKSGFKAVDAAAIEAVGSTGDVLIPPVMGTVAFLIAQYLGIPYSKLIVYAAPPAIMYYAAVFAAAHWKARKAGLSGIPNEALPSLRQVIIEGGHLGIPLIALVVMMMMGFSVARCGFVAIIGMIAMSFLKKETRMKPLDVIGILGDTSRGAAVVASTLILVGVVTGVVNISGLGVTISMLTERLSGGSIVIALVLAAITATILGLALSGMIVYIYGAVFVIPTLIKLGADPVAAHLFFLYYGTLGNITPPVCVTAFTAAAIAGAQMMKTGLVASRIAFVGFLLPFLFVLNPAIVLQHMTWVSVPVLSLGFIGVLVCAAGMEGYFLKELSVFERIVLIISGLSLLLGAVWTAGLLIGFVLLIMMYVETYVRKKAHRRQST